MKNLWGADPKVHRFGEKSALFLFWNTSMENIWKCIKDNISGRSVALTASPNKLVSEGITALKLIRKLHFKLTSKNC